MCDTARENGGRVMGASVAAAEPVEPGFAGVSADAVASDAIRTALTSFMVVLPPETARKIAVSCLRLAAAMVALAETTEVDGVRGAAAEWLLLLAEGAPELREPA